MNQLYLATFGKRCAFFGAFSFAFLLLCASTSTFAGGELDGVLSDGDYSDDGFMVVKPGPLKKNSSFIYRMLTGNKINDNAVPLLPIHTLADPVLLAPAQPKLVLESKPVLAQPTQHKEPGCGCWQGLFKKR